MCISAILGIGGALIGASASNRAADAQETAANAQIAAAERNAAQIRSDMSPWRESGMVGQNALAFNLGLGDRPEGYTGFELSPYQRMGIEKGRDIIEAGASAQGGLYSGATMQALDSDRMGRAQGAYEGYLDRLTGISNSGQNAAAQSAAASTNSTNATMNALANIGNAQASGAIGVGNALTSGIDTGLGIWSYQNNLDRNPQNSRNSNWLFGGNSWG